MQEVIGGDIGATNLRLALINRDGEIVKKIEAKIPENKEKIIEKTTKMIAKLSGKPSIISIGVAGLVDFAKGFVINTPNFNFNDIELQKIIQKKFNLPCIVDNDANMAAWGEKIYGAGKKAKNIVNITLGTGIGGGIIIDDKIYRGSYFIAGEIGHMTIGSAKEVKSFGIKADFEKMASGRALGTLAKNEIKKNPKSLIRKIARNKIENITGKTVTMAARQGDETAIRLIEQISEIISIGLANLVNVLDPELIIITGGVSKDASLFIPGIKKHLYKRILSPDYRKPDIVSGKLGPDAGIVGAGAMAFYPYG